MGLYLAFHFENMTPIKTLGYEAHFLITHKTVFQLSEVHKWEN